MLKDCFFQICIVCESPFSSDGAESKGAVHFPDPSLETYKALDNPPPIHPKDRWFDFVLCNRLTRRQPQFYIR